MAVRAGIATPSWKSKPRRSADAQYERPEELSQEHREVLIETLVIAAQQEATVMPWQATAFDTAPDLGAKMAIAGSIQDELGHANQWCLTLENLGYDSREAIFGTPAEKYKTVYLEHFPIRDYIEFVMTQAFFDRAGRFWTVDFERHSSYAPMRRVARKVNFEQAFHVFHGEQWTKYYYSASEETHEHVTKLTKEMFPHGQQWFGAPDDRKSRVGQLTFRIRGWSNDEMRGKWLASITSLAEKVGFGLPVRYDQPTGTYISQVPFPMTFDPETRTWSGKEATWDEVFQQWKRGGPQKTEIIGRIHAEEWGDDLWTR